MARFSKPNSTDAVGNTACCEWVLSEKRGNDGFSIAAQLTSFFMDVAAAQGFAAAKMVQALGLAKPVKKKQRA